MDANLKVYLIFRGLISKFLKITGFQNRQKPKRKIRLYICNVSARLCPMKDFRQGYDLAKVGKTDERRKQVGAKCQKWQEFTSTLPTFDTERSLLSPKQKGRT